MHWALDVIWNEDNNNIKSHNAQKVVNAFRKLVHFRVDIYRHLHM